MTQKQFENLFSLAKDLMAKTKDPVHNWSHVERVLANAQKIKRFLPVSKIAEIDDKILIISAAWHDIDFVFHEPGIKNYFLEGPRAASIAKKFLKAEKLDSKEIKLIMNIIKHHTFSSFGALNEKRSIYHQIVQDADTMDFFADVEVRVKATQEQAQKIFFYKLVVKFLKPIFLNYLLKHPKRVYNLPEIIKNIKAIKQ